MKNKIYLFLLTLLALAACSDNTKVTNISLNPSELIMKIGDTAHIEMIISPISAIIYNPTAWSSSNPNVAQVNDNGKVTAIKEGTDDATLFPYLLKIR